LLNQLCIKKKGKTKGMEGKLSQVSMQLLWKAWLQVGSNLNLSLSENSHKQTAQSKGSLGPTTSLYKKTSNASINA